MQVSMNELVMRRIAMMLVVLMGLVSLVPRVEASFVASDEFFSSVSRQNDMTTIQGALEQKLLRERLKELGYTEDEIKARLDRLPDNELHALATQLDSLVPAGDGTGVVIAVLVIVILVLVILMLTGHRIHVS
ncbi:MAG TPA: PA2779 family protein [Syntrophobacteria bacterium]|nr:PA2779 family protein [Syntrophobacteria bacterium]